MELWKTFLHDHGPQLQQNIFDYISNSTNNFLQMQEHVQEQFSTQAEKFINMMQFPFNKGNK